MTWELIDLRSNNSVSSFVHQDDALDAWDEIDDMNIALVSFDKDGLSVSAELR